MSWQLKVVSTTFSKCYQLYITQWYLDIFIQITISPVLQYYLLLTNYTFLMTKFIRIST